jgi:hypothetical protein
MAAHRNVTLVHSHVIQRLSKFPHMIHPAKTHLKDLHPATSSDLDRYLHQLQQTTTMSSKKNKPSGVRGNKNSTDDQPENILQAVVSFQLSTIDVI